MRRYHDRGFSLIELAITVLVLGIVLAFSVPAFQVFSASQQLKGSAENVGGWMRLARERAVATGTPQQVHFNTFVPDTDWHTHDGTRLVGGSKLPKNVTFYTVTAMPTFTSDGRASASGIVVLQDSRGNRDTVSVLTSGLVVVQ